MRAQGLDVISLSVGEPDFNTPDVICEAAERALRSGDTKYTASAGTPDLKLAVCEKLIRENGLDATPDRVVVSCGAKHSIYNALMTTVDPGDEVILIAPYWMTYLDQVQLAGGRAVVVKTAAESGFVPTADQIREAITPRTKAIILNSPSNPTGGIIPRDVLADIVEIARQHGLWIIADEIYERLTYAGPHVSVSQFGPEAMEQTILVSGCSKTFAMTGWRIGYLYAPPTVAQAISNLQDQVTSNPTSFAQAGAAAALRMPSEVVDAMRDEFAARRDLVLGLLNEIPGLETPVPGGAFYVFPNVQPFLQGRFRTDVELADHLLETSLVATVPGSVFEGPGHLRLSYAASRENLERAIRRIGDALGELGP